MPEKNDPMIARTLQLVLPGVWIGLLVGLAFIETPLKFLAPGVTLEMALGIGRLVLTAADIAGVALLAAITLVSVLQPRVVRSGVITLAVLWLVLLPQVAIIRPLLNVRTDTILAGGDPGESILHIVYVVADVILCVGLVFFLSVVARGHRPAALQIEGR